MVSSVPRNAVIRGFELLVQRLRAADEADAGQAVAPAVVAPRGGGDDVADRWPGRGNCWRRSSAPRARPTTAIRAPWGVSMTRSSLYSPASRISASCSVRCRLSESYIGCEACLRFDG